jgi:ubiquinone/menaquinone biosynthesis C-methylase UbiE
MKPTDKAEYVLPSTKSESERLETQARLYGGVDFLRPFIDKKPARVLEVGCGTGFFSRFAAEQLSDSQVVGVDMDQGRLEYARSKTQLSNLQFQTGDLSSLPFDNDQFDLVFCRFVLVHSSEPSAALREMARVSKPGGNVLAYEMVHDGIWTSPEKPALKKLLKQLIEVMRQRGMEPSQGLHLAPSMIRIGLQEVEVKVIPHSCLSIESVFEDYRTNWIDTLRGLDDILGQKFDNQLVDQALDELHSRDVAEFLLELTVLASGRKA